MTSKDVSSTMNSNYRNNQRVHSQLLPFLLFITISYVVSHLNGPVHTDEEKGIPQNLGKMLLLSGGIPWILQAIAVGSAYVCMLSGSRILSFREILSLLAVPIVLGVIWWGSVGYELWNRDILDVVVEFRMKNIFGRSSEQGFWGILTHDVLEPVVFPLTLQGPYSLKGWSFIWSGFSTFFMMGFLIIVAPVLRKIALTKGSVFSAVFIVASVVVYLSPVYLRYILY